MIKPQHTRSKYKLKKKEHIKECNISKKIIITNEHAKLEMIYKIHFGPLRIFLK